MLYVHNFRSQKTEGGDVLFTTSKAQLCVVKDGKCRHTFPTVSTKTQPANSAGSKTGSVDTPFPLSDH